jgi:serine phosphatase RsbU (regulator of sigma subunit)
VNTGERGRNPRRPGTPPAPGARHPAADAAGPFATIHQKCEKPTMRLIVLERSTQLAEIACREEAVYIGSDRACEVCLPDPQVAAQLAVIYAEDDDVWVFEQVAQDAQIQLNGAPVTEKVRLRVGDQIKIHDYVIRAESKPAPPVKTAAPPPPAKRTTLDRMMRFVQYRLPPGTVVKKAYDEVTIGPEPMGKIGQLNVLLGQCATVEQLMETTLAALIESFGAHRAWMGVRRLCYGPLEYVEGRFATGQTADLPTVGENLKPRVLDRDQFAVLPYGDDSDPASVLTGPLMGAEGSLGMAFIDAGESERRYDPQDLDFFILLLNTATAQLEAIFAQIAKNRAAMLEGEVTVAHAIQTRLTPRKLPQWSELQFGAFREMGHERTSDIYDLLRLSNQMALFMIAHTSAGGPVPSMLMAQAQAAFRVAAMHLDAPHIYLRSLNNLVYDGTQDHLLDCFIGVIEPPTGNMRYARAGNIGAYIISNRGEERVLGTPEPTPSVAATKDPEYALHPEKLKPGETLVLFTPGVVTARNSRGEIFGEERFVNILCDGFGQQASGMLREMLSDLKQFTEAGTQPDDITVILAHRL